MNKCIPSPETLMFKFPKYLVKMSSVIFGNLRFQLSDVQCLFEKYSFKQQNNAVWISETASSCIIWRCSAPISWQHIGSRTWISFLIMSHIYAAHPWSSTVGTKNCIILKMLKQRSIIHTPIKIGSTRHTCLHAVISWVACASTPWTAFMCKSVCLLWGKIQYLAVQCTLLKCSRLQKHNMYTEIWTHRKIWFKNFPPQHVRIYSSNPSVKLMKPPQQKSSNLMVESVWSHYLLLNTYNIYPKKHWRRMQEPNAKRLKKHVNISTNPWNLSILNYGTKVPRKFCKLTQIKLPI